MAEIDKAIAEILVRERFETLDVHLRAAAIEAVQLSTVCATDETPEAAALMGSVVVSIRDARAAAGRANRNHSHVLANRFADALPVVSKP